MKNIVFNGGRRADDPLETYTIYFFKWIFLGKWQICNQLFCHYTNIEDFANFGLTELIRYFISNIDNTNNNNSILKNNLETIFFAFITGRINIWKYGHNAWFINARRCRVIQHTFLRRQKDILKGASRDRRPVWQIPVKILFFLQKYKNKNRPNLVYKQKKKKIENYFIK